MSLLACQGCGKSITRPRTGRRKWCSERCRKNQYRVPCERCGAPCGGIGTQGGGRAVPRFCSPCGQEHATEVKAAQHAALAARVEGLWAEGRTLHEIAIVMGWKSERVASVRVCTLRAEGADLPIRNIGASRANRDRWAAARSAA